MSIENIAHRFEREAQTNPEEAAASMKFLTQASQERILQQMQKDANDPNTQANMSVERDRSGNIQAIHFTPLYEGSTAGAADRPARR